MGALGSAQSRYLMHSQVLLGHIHIYRKCAEPSGRVVYPNIFVDCGAWETSIQLRIENGSV